MCDSNLSSGDLVSITARRLRRLLMRLFLSLRTLSARAMLALAACSFLQALPCAAQDTDVAKSIRAHLDAGEFGLAQDIARSANTPRQRDALSRPIVAAQAAAGMFQASLESASSIQGDSERASAFGDLSQMPVGSSEARGG